MDFKDDFILTQTNRIIQCFQACTGQSLRARLNIEESLADEELAKALYFAKSAVLSHDIRITEHGRDNIYNYANQTALNVFERTFEEQTALPSTQSAAARETSQTQRNTLLGQCLSKGWVQFSTERLSSTGKTVPLRDAILFNLFDDTGMYFGQAVVFEPICSRDFGER